jgi:hypothetical protein
MEGIGHVLDVEVVGFIFPSIGAPTGRHDAYSLGGQSSYVQLDFMRPEARSRNGRRMHTKS